MKKRNLFLLCTVLLSAVFASDGSALKREHRATWMSAYTQDWPSAPITSSSAELHKNYALAYLDSLQRNNFTTIYYHARVMCDAAYDSKYEPWSEVVASSRGVKPPFDPLGFLTENAHAHGLEVYAWMNPYRYLNSTLRDSWGSAGGDKNYENTHPEWLIKYQFINKDGKLQTWTILNPALPEVKQQIVNVVADILSKYDVDGIVFDDYFYQDGLPLSYDAGDYDKYVADFKAAHKDDPDAKPLAQMDWRRENVNDMVRRVNARIKREKPWVRFGIGPAGVAASDASVAAKYGVEPCPGSDWQYNTIASDPLAWLSEGSIDFISPQVYWKIGNAAANYALIAPWWYKVAAKFNRHCFISQDLSNTAGNASPLSEFYDQISITHTSVLKDAPGTVYFPWRSLRDKRERIDGKWVTLMSYLRGSLFSTPSLTPAVNWVNAPNPGQVSAVSRNGRKLSWNGPENVRFTVYAVPAGTDASSFFKDAEYLRGISYGKTFEIPQPEDKYPGYGIADADLGKYKYAVAVLDRYGNEYAAVFEGASVGTSKTPALSYPIGGVEVPQHFQFRWSGSAPVYEVRVAADSEMKHIIGKMEVSGTVADASEICSFEPDVTYYWTVAARENNAVETCAPVQSFKVNVFRILSPAENAVDTELTPELRCVAVGGARSYNFLVSKDSGFSNVVFERTISEPTVKIPKYLLAGNTTYYAKAKVAIESDVVVEADVRSFRTKNVPVTVPVFATPKTDGETLHSNWRISLEPQEGVVQTTIVVSASNAFPARSSYTGRYSSGVFYTPHLEEIKLISKPLESGQPYFARAQYTYVGEDGRQQTTDWTAPVSFVYDSEAGLADVQTGGIYVVGGDNAALVTEKAGLAVSVCLPDGKVVLETVTGADGRVSFAGLPEGLYLVAVRQGNAVRTLRFVR